MSLQRSGAGRATRLSRYARALQSPVETWALSRNTRRVLSLNGRHAGATIFVVGSGPQLNRLSPEQHEALAGAVTIGLNRVQYRLPTTFFLSAYPSEVMLAARRLRQSTLIHMRPTYAAPLVPGALTVRRRIYQKGDRLPRRFKGPAPALLTKQNVALGATHLAMILAATRIAYIGVEQRAAAHFYDEQPEVREEILADLATLTRRDVFTADHPYATYDYIVENLRRDPTEMQSADFYKTDHTATFRAYFRQLRKHGVEPIATTQNSVVFDAGARLMNLDDLLAEAHARAAKP